MSIRHVIASNTYRIIKLIIRKSMLIMSINSPFKKRVETVMVNNSTNINKTNNYLSS